MVQFGAMHRIEVRHVRDVVDQFAAVGVDLKLGHFPLGPLVVEAGIDARDRLFLDGRIAFRVVPDEQQVVLLCHRPGLDLCPRRNALGVGNVVADPIGAPAPFMEGAADGVALDAALAQVRAHVRAVAVEDVDLPVLPGEGHQAGAEGIQAVSLAVAVLGSQAQAMPAAGIAGFQLLGFDSVQSAHLLVLPSGSMRAASGSGGPSQLMY
ncbi:hypothetical protein D3C76_1252610 [compost metagenome]